MPSEKQYPFDSLDVDRMLESPELPEMLAALLDLYHKSRKSEEQQRETIQSLLDRIYGRKSEKAKYGYEKLRDVADDIPYINGIRHDLNHDTETPTTVAA